MLGPYGNVMAIHGSALLIFFNNFRTFFRNRSVNPKIVKHVVFFVRTQSLSSSRNPNTSIQNLSMFTIAKR